MTDAIRPDADAIVAHHRKYVIFIAPGGAANEVAGMAGVKKPLLEHGVITFLRSNLIAIAAPLPITRAEIEEGLGAVDKALEVADCLLGTTA